jgi:glycosyltransferase involved in cell wall biosynthesis
VLSHALDVPKFERRIFYIPIDFVRLPYAWGDSFRDLDTLIVASKFGQKVAMNYNKESVYIPHGVDCNIFKKLTDSERRFLRKQQNIKDDDFVVSFVGKPLVRKMLPTMLKVFEEFAKDKGDVKLLMASDPNEKSMRCVNYVSLAQQLGIQEKMLVPPLPVSRFPLGDSTMSNTFNMSDVHLFLSGAEGFGLPVLETQACGVPQIVSDYTTLPELVEGHGKIVPIAGEIANESGVFYGVADEGKAVEALNFYYDNRDELKEDGKKSIEFAKKFDYNTSDIIPKWIEVLESDIMSWEVY